jgi:hypothetical protein
MKNEFFADYDRVEQCLQNFDASGFEEGLIELPMGGFSATLIDLLRFPDATDDATNEEENADGERAEVRRGTRRGMRRVEVVCR